MPFHVDGAHRTTWAKGLAHAATDTHLLIHHRNLLRLRVVGIDGDHRDGTRRTMPLAVAAVLVVTYDNTELTRPYRMADLDARLLLLRDGLDGTSRTHTRTLDALWTAIAALITHLRLHEGHQTGRRTKHSVRTSGYAQLAGRTMVLHVAGTQGTRRGQSRGAYGLLFSTISARPPSTFLSVASSMI